MILDQLASLVGKPYVVPPAEVEQRYLVDETGGRAGAVRGLVRPASTEEVSQVLKLCLALGQKVVVQGGADRHGARRAPR